MRVSEHFVNGSEGGQREAPISGAPQDLPLLMTKKQCAHFLQIRLRTLEKFVALGRIPVIRLSAKTVRFHREDVLAALRN